MASITYENATLVYPGASSPSVNEINLEIQDGEFLVLVGPSGCGKSTTLRMLAGLEQVTGGRILIGGNDVTNVEPKMRDIAMVFQNYALYPHMTVGENMGFALKMAKVPKEEIKQRVEEAAKLLDITKFLDRKPKALSGGQRQRVAMGRAIVRDPQVFLMDEPLSNLDAKLRVQTRGEIARLQRRLGVTTVYVTHDQVEAMTMGDRVAVLKDGKLQQCAPPAELYADPHNAFVASFIGSPAMNLYHREVSADRHVRVGGHEMLVPEDAGASVIVGIRPEHLKVADSGIEAVVDVIEELGSDDFLYCTTGNGHKLVARGKHGRDISPGSTVHFEFDSSTVLYFDGETEERLRK